MNPGRRRQDGSIRHFSDHDLERYYLGMLTEEEELARIEEHLLWCATCLARAEQAQDYVDAVRVALLKLHYL